MLSTAIQLLRDPQGSVCVGNVSDHFLHGHSRGAEGWKKETEAGDKKETEYDAEKKN
jgi:hypothetical protein